MALESLLEDIGRNKKKISDSIENNNVEQILDLLNFGEGLIDYYQKNKQEIRIESLSEISEYNKELLDNLISTYFSRDSLIDDKKYMVSNKSEEILEGIFSIFEGSESMFIQVPSKQVDKKDNKSIKIKEDVINNLRQTITRLTKIPKRSRKSNQPFITPSLVNSLKEELINNFNDSYEKYLSLSEELKQYSIDMNKRDFVDIENFDEIIKQYSIFVQKKDKIKSLFSLRFISEKEKNNIMHQSSLYKNAILDYINYRSIEELRDISQLFNQLKEQFLLNPIDNIKKSKEDFETLKKIIYTKKEQLNTFNIESKIFQERYKEVEEILENIYSLKDNKKLYDNCKDWLNSPDYNMGWFNDIVNNFISLNESLKKNSIQPTLTHEMSNFVRDYLIEFDKRIIISDIDYDLEDLLKENKNFFLNIDEAEGISKNIGVLKEYIDNYEDALDNLKNIDDRIKKHSLFLDIAKEIKSQDHLLLKKKYFNVDQLSKIDSLREYIRGISLNIDINYKQKIGSLLDKHIEEIITNFNDLFVDKINEVNNVINDKKISLDEKINIISKEKELIGDIEKLKLYINQDNFVKYEQLIYDYNKLIDRSEGKLYRFLKGAKTLLSRPTDKVKTFVLDTNILLHNPDVMYTFGDNEVVIPEEVIEEIDKKKKGKDDISFSARNVSTKIDYIRSELNKKGKHLSDGLITKEGGLIRFEPKSSTDRKLSKFFDLYQGNKDNPIMDTYFKIKRSNTYSRFKKRKTILISKDKNMRTLTDIRRGIVQDSESDKVKNLDELYKGYRSIEVDREQINSYYDTKKLDHADLENLISNEFVIVKDKDSKEVEFLLRKKGDKLLYYDADFTKTEAIRGVKPRNLEQYMALILLNDPSLKLVILEGSAGTGKTYLACAAGIKEVIDEERYDTLLLSKAPAEMGKDKLGAVPGGVNDKLGPSYKSFNDNITKFASKEGEESNYEIPKLIKKGSIEMQPTQTIRGRTFTKVYGIMDETQNSTAHEVKTIVTRFEDDSRLIILGDIGQIDNQYLDAYSNGISVIIDKTREYMSMSQDKIGIIRLTQSERSFLAKFYGQIL